MAAGMRVDKIEEFLFWRIAKNHQVAEANRMTERELVALARKRFNADGQDVRAAFMRLVRKGLLRAEWRGSDKIPVLSNLGEEAANHARAARWRFIATWIGLIIAAAGVAIQLFK